MSISYVHLLLIFTGALLFILIQVLLKKPWHSRSVGLQILLKKPHREDEELYQDYLVPLLVYEEEYPAFGSILGLVLKKFPLSRFLEHQDFKRALTYLRDSVFQDTEHGELVSTMGLIVHTFIRDPDVEYACRPHLQRFLQQFLKEVESGEKPAVGSAP